MAIQGQAKCIQESTDIINTSDSSCNNTVSKRSHEGASHSALDTGQASPMITVKAGTQAWGNYHSMVGRGVLAVCLKELRPSKPAIFIELLLDSFAL